MRNTLRPVTRHPRLAIGTALVAILAIGAGVLVSSPQRHHAPPVYTPAKRARSYTAYTACLLTGPNGITDADDAPVWAGMQAASGATHAQVSYLPLPAPRNASNAAAYINALAMRGCELIVASGTAAGQGVASRAAALPRIRFITVGAPAGKAANITAVSTTTPTAITHAITTLVTEAANQGSATD